MLKEVDWSSDGSYRTGTDFEPLQFYLDALTNSNRLDLLLGYFSSSAINVLSLGFARFLSIGGTVRLIVNDVLSGRDKHAIERGIKDELQNNIFDITNFKGIKDSLDNYGSHFFECLSWLVANKKIEIKIIRPKSGNGISHYKSGIFSDNYTSVGFKASCNFTAFGLLENLEEVDTYFSWENGRSEKWILSQNKYFENIFSAKADFVEYVDVTNIREAIIDHFDDKCLNKLIIQEKELLEKKYKLFQNKSLKKVITKTLKRIEHELSEPKFPFPQGPRDYQEIAHSNWKNNYYQGIFAMATGTGKTITSLNCILNDYNERRDYKALILVPTNVLVQQWGEEARKFNFRGIIKVSSKFKEWQDEIDRILTQINFGIATSFIVISTYATFIKPKFQDYFKRFPAKTILIADEAHNIGAPGVTKILKRIHLNKRIGLSATPKRVYDPEGASKMEDFFNDKEPYTYSFTMEKAIDEGILCQYYYYPKLVSLTEEELEDYTSITERLVKYFNYSKNKLEKNSIVEQLLMQRKRIIHKAENKLGVFSDILHEIENKHEKLDYTLVYAPEGYFSDDIYINENFGDLTEENRIIDFYANTIRRECPETTLAQYVSDSADKEFILNQFSKGSLDVLLSMKCLDEGVDIPRTEKAIFCSSTGNPRQFIQRRGRILRKHPNKLFAYVYDMVVIPRIDFNSKNFQLERTMVQKELERVVHFGYMALNKYDAIKPFEGICNYYQLNLDTIHNELI